MTRHLVPGFHDNNVAAAQKQVLTQTGQTQQHGKVIIDKYDIVMIVDDETAKELASSFRQTQAAIMRSNEGLNRASVRSRGDMDGQHTDETEEELLAMNKCDIALFEYAKARVTPVHEFRDIVRA